MTSEELQNALAQNRENLKALLDALEADYEVSEDPRKEARLGAAFNPNPEAAKSRADDGDMTDEEWAAWLFEENAKALAAAAEAAGARSAKSPDVAESDGMTAVKDALGGE